MDKFNKKIVVSFVIIFLLVLAAILFIFFVQIPKIKATSENIQKERLDSFVEQVKGDKIFKLKKEMGGIEEQKKEMESMFIKQNESVPFFETMEKAARDANCTLKVVPADLGKVKFSQSQAAPKKTDDEDEDSVKKSVDTKAANEAANPDDISKLKPYPAFNVEIEGTFLQTSSFLEKMENLPHFARILIFSLDPVKASAKPSGSSAGALASGIEAEADSALQQNTLKLSMLIVVYANDEN